MSHLIIRTPFACIAAALSCAYVVHADPSKSPAVVEKEVTRSSSRMSPKPAPRTDKNSKIAHQQLLEKARYGATRGRVDVYFIGDSITRRWGCTDPQYGDLRDSWRKNFFGWNAANFAWGGDTTSNILWRLENGELDGLSPKVFVVLAGTNNLGPSPKTADAFEIARGIKAILDTCQRKVPSAKIVLVAVFPRNDNEAANPVIDEINKQISEFADGNRIRLLNVNRALVNENGRLIKKMTTDGLHLARPGYEVWADGLRPILREWLGPPAENDLAPPPTGDPSAAPPAKKEELNAERDQKP